MKKIGMWTAILLIVGVIVGISGCTSDNSEYEPTETVDTSTDTSNETTEPTTTEEPSSSSLGTGATNCPVCGMPGEFKEEDMYWCEDCGILWMVDYSNDCKWASSILDYEDDGRLTDDEIYMVPL